MLILQFRQSTSRTRVQCKCNAYCFHQLSPPSVIGGNSACSPHHASKARNLVPRVFWVLVALKNAEKAQGTRLHMTWTSPVNLPPQPHTVRDQPAFWTNGRTCQFFLVFCFKKLNRHRQVLVASSLERYFRSFFGGVHNLRLPSAWTREAKEVFPTATDPSVRIRR